MLLNLCKNECCLPLTKDKHKPSNCGIFVIPRRRISSRGGDSGDDVVMDSNPLDICRWGFSSSLVEGSGLLD